MQTPPDLDQMPVRAARAAVLALGRVYAPLTREQSIVVACAAVFRAGQTLDGGLPLEEQEAMLMQSAQLALAAAILAAGDDRTAACAMLVGGIERLPRLQQLVFALRFEHDMSDGEIAMVLGCTERDVIVQTTMALDALRPHPPLRLAA